MVFGRNAAAIALALACGATAVATAAAPIDRQELGRRLEEASNKAQNNDCQSSLNILTGVVTQKEFKALDEVYRAAAFELAAICAMRVRDTTSAYTHAFAGTRLTGASTYLWSVRVGLEVEGKRYLPAIETIEAMASSSPEALNAQPIRTFYALNGDLKKQSDKALQRRLLAVMTAPAYEPDEVPATTDFFKLQYAAMLADSGNTTAAAALIAQIKTPSELAEASVDLRFRGMLPPDFDGRAAAEGALAHAREVAASHPGSLGAVLEIAEYLRLLGRSEEALATLEAARPDGALGETFTDLDERRNWWWDAMAISYQMLGRYDDAATAYRQGITAKEDGNLNVSQTLNLGSAQLRFGRPAEALATIAAFEAGNHSISPYGKMVLSVVRSCAHFALKQDKAAQADLEYATAHKDDGPGALTKMRLCAGDLDGAAAEVIRRLDDPDLRVAALLMLSDYDAPPPHYPPASFENAFKAMKVRPDVQAAVARAGGTRRFRFQDR